MVLIKEYSFNLKTKNFLIQKNCHCEELKMQKQYRLNKVIFKNLVSLINEFYKKWITSPSLIHSMDF